MKKILSILLTLGLLLSFAGCAKQAAPQAGPQGTPEELIAKIYENHQAVELSVMTRDIDLTKIGRAHV